MRKSMNINSTNYGKWQEQKKVDKSAIQTSYNLYLKYKIFHENWWFFINYNSVIIENIKIKIHRVAIISMVTYVTESIVLSTWKDKSKKFLK